MELGMGMGNGFEKIDQVGAKDGKFERRKYFMVLVLLTRGFGQKGMLGILGHTDDSGHRGRSGKIGIYIASPTLKFCKSKDQK